MPGPKTSRREFFSSSASLAGSGWIALHWPAIAALSACARDAAQRGAGFTVLTTAEASTMRAFAAQLIPSDAELPGAEEAGAVYFVDGALAGPFSGLLEPVRDGIEALDEQARAAGAAAFAELDDAQQIEAIERLEAGPFFFPMRMLVVMGVFAEPKHGGNREHAGFRILGMDHAAAYQPPFGYYDAEAARMAQAGGA